MANRSLFRLPSRDLSAILAGKKIKLPFPCLSMMGAEVAAQFGIKGPDGQPIIPRRLYIDKFDPLTFLRYWPFNAEAICETEVMLPRHVVQLHAQGNLAQDVTDQLSTAARDLLTALAEYKGKFLTEQNGQSAEKPSTTDRQEAYKANVRAGVQRAFLNYQFRQLQELKRVLRKHVFQTVHPGCFAPVIPDPSLAIDEVRIPCEIWPAFVDQHALVLRHPVLDVLYRLKPVKGSDMAIALNPLLFPRVNADCDGDTLFITPMPSTLDGGQVFVSDDCLVYDEANVLAPKLEGDLRHQPADCPPLNLHDFGPESAFSKFVAEHGIRNYKNAIYTPMDDEKYFEESMAAAARFRWEKDSIGRADWVRRTLEIMTDDPATLRSINKFCSVVSQKAIDAGKHRENFPLDRYMRCFRCRFEAVGGNGPYMETFDAPDHMAAELVGLTSLPELFADALKICQMLFSWPEFQEVGMQGLIDRYFPWWALACLKRTVPPTDGKMMREARLLMNMDTALAGQCNLLW